MTPLRVIAVEETPNPNARKVVLDRPAFAAPVSCRDAASAAGHPLARRLFEVRGVCGVLLLGDFVTVTKAPAATWRSVLPAVRRAIEATEK